MTRFPLAAAVVSFAVLAAADARATSYVEISDEALARQAHAIAVVNVLSAGAAPAVGPPSTDYIVVVERLLKGTVSGSTIVVRVAGGIGPDGWGLDLVGAPRFFEGDRAILFLVPRNDGTYGILHWMLGAFHSFEIGDRHLAVRDLLETRPLSAEGDSRPRDFEAFAEWLSGNADRADYRVSIDSGRLERWQRAFGVLRHERRRLRWFEDQVEWFLGRPAHPRLRRTLKSVLRAWSPIASLELVYGGRSDSRSGLHSFDGENVLTTGDRDDVIPGSFDCGSGGVVAVGGPWFDPEITAKRQPGSGHLPSIRILGADVVLNDGAECLLEVDGDLAFESLIHELGHTLGLGTSCGDSVSGPCRGDAATGAMRAILDAAGPHQPDGSARLPGERERGELQHHD